MTDAAAGKITVAQADHAPAWAGLAATFFGIGRLRPGPGTWGSAAAVLLWAAIARWIPVALRTEVLAVLALLAVTIGIPAATRFAKASGRQRSTIRRDR